MSDFLQDHPDGQIISADEMSLYLQATTTRLWAPCGQTPIVRVSGQRDPVHFYGALNLCTGHEFALPRLEMTSLETADFLRDLFACYPDQPLLLLWDRATWHQGQPVADVLAAHPRVETVFFPPASPDLNPQEHVWSLARAFVSHNHTLPTCPPCAMPSCVFWVPPHFILHGWRSTLHPFYCDKSKSFIRKEQ